MKDYNKNKKDLLYKLIFGEVEDHILDISDYINDIYDYEKFVKETREILEISKVNVLNSSVKVNSKTVTWELKVSK